MINGYRICIICTNDITINVDFIWDELGKKHTTIVVMNPLEKPDHYSFFSIPCYDNRVIPPKKITLIQYHIISSTQSTKLYEEIWDIMDPKATFIRKMYLDISKIATDVVAGDMPATATYFVHKAGIVGFHPLSDIDLNTEPVALFPELREEYDFICDKMIGETL